MADDPSAPGCSSRWCGGSLRHSPSPSPPTVNEMPPEAYPSDQPSERHFGHELHPPRPRRDRRRVGRRDPAGSSRLVHHRRDRLHGPPPDRLTRPARWQARVVLTHGATRVLRTTTAAAARRRPQPAAVLVTRDELEEG